MEPHERARFNALTQQVDLLERQVAFLMKHVGATFRDERPPHNAIEQKIIAGDRIGAIKLMQQERGLDLAAAKRAVEELAARRGL